MTIPTADYRFQVTGISGIEVKPGVFNPLPAGLSYNEGTGDVIFDPTGHEEYIALGEEQHMFVQFQYEITGGSKAVADFIVEGVNDAPTANDGLLRDFRR